MLKTKRASVKDVDIFGHVGFTRKGIVLAIDHTRDQKYGNKLIALNVLSIFFFF
jgi:hypothetical protein